MKQGVGQEESEGREIECVRGLQLVSECTGVCASFEEVFGEGKVTGTESRDKMIG